jgi:uncharacterized membrane-anchored protein YhcB (DUF1043 family)
MFWTGLIVGLVIGTFMGLLVAGLCQMARQNDEEIEHD